jgi:hypothetical protein
MPCMGPDKTWSDQQAQGITKEILLLLKTKGVGRGDLDTPNDQWSFGDELKPKLLAVIEEICWDDACNSF